MRPMLLLFVSHGCPACASARPEWEKYKSKHPLDMLLELDADGPYAGHLVGPKPIRVTPLYVLKDGDEVTTHEGAMRAEQIEKWVRAIVGISR